MRKKSNPKFLDNLIGKFRKPAKSKRDNARRDQILGVSTVDRDITPVSLNWAQVEALINEKFMSSNERQNGSPTAIEFLSFMKAWPSATATGYAVHPDRGDYRVTIEGLRIGVKGMSKTEKGHLLNGLKLLLTHSSSPDEFEKTSAEWRVWWD